MSAAEGVALSRRLLSLMVAHARRDAPNECVGFLAGDGSTVRALFPARNIATSPRTRYEADPKDIIRFVHAIEMKGWAWVGSYHSHPRSRAWPSPTDIGLAVSDWYPGFVYVLVSLEADAEAKTLFSAEVSGRPFCSLTYQARPVVQAFHIAGGEVHQRPILIR